MRPSNPLHLLAPLLLLFPLATAQKDRIPLSSIATLTLRAGLPTTHRRVPSIPQLRCVGGLGCAHYAIDVLRCKNAGSTYEASDVQWTCTASLPPDFRLGATDVICEGYSGPEDAQVLKGSCGVEYRLLLTREGEERFGKGSGEEGGWGGDGAERGVNVLFWVIFFGIIGWVLWALWRNRGEGLQGRPLGGGGGGGWGGGGGGGHDDGDDDPPPPYDYRPEQKPDPSREAQGWRPGFWSGLAGGAAAGYLANQRRQAAPPATGPSNWFNNRGRSSGSGSSSGSTGYSSTSYESTGFGSSSRR